MNKISPKSSELAKKLVVFCVALALTACGEEKPYTPFQVATSVPGQLAAPIAQSASTKISEADEPPVVSLRAPEGARDWKAFGRTIISPPQNHIHIGIEVPGTPSEQVAVWFLPENNQAPAVDSGLWLIDEKGKMLKRLLSLPNELPRGTDCRFRASLKQSGKQSFISRVQSECSTRVLPGTPVEFLAAVSPSREQPVLLELSLSAPAPGELFSLVASSEDRDQDGKDDLEIQVSLTSPEGVEESLPLRWLSRTAGASREANSPSKELAKRASRLVTASLRKKERAKVTHQVEALRRLLAATCSQGAAQKLSLRGTKGLDCGNLHSTLLRLSDAVIQAELGQKNFELALGEAERGDWFFEARSAAEAKSLQKLLKKKIPGQKAKLLARFKIQVKRPPSIHLSPLLFDEGGQLWAQTSEGATKRLTMKGDPPLITPATENEAEKKIKAPTWSLAAIGPGGATLTAALPSCNRSEVQLVLNDKKGAPITPIPLPMLAPRPGACKNLSAFPMNVTALRAKDGPLLAIVGGQVVTAEGHPRALSSSIAWGTNFGLALKTKNSFELLTGDDAQELSHCVVSDDDKKVACVAGDSVHVLAGTL